jgi:hypothetical protein
VRRIFGGCAKINKPIQYKQMTDTAVGTTGAPPPLGLPARFAGIITSPRETFTRVVAFPRWLGMLVLVTAIAAIFTALPMTTEAGKAATLRAQVQSVESFGMTVSDQMYDGMRRQVDFAAYTTAASVLVMSPVVTLVLTGILFAVFNVALGGEATFRQAFAVVVHASAITALQQLFTGPINYVRGEVTSATNLAALAPMVDATSFAGRALAMIDIFLIWYLLVLAMGFAVLYRRKTQPIAFTFFGLYAVIVLVAAAVLTRLGGA